MPIKVLYILHSGNSLAGSTKAILSLISQGKDTIEPIIVMPEKGELYDYLNQQNYRVYNLFFRPACYPHFNTLKDVILFLPRLCARLICNWHTTHQLVKIIRNEHVQIVHSNSGVISCGFLAAKKAGISHIWHLREYAEHAGFAFYPNRAHHLHQLQRSHSICITGDIQSFYHLQQNPMSSVIYDGVIHQIHANPIYQGQYLLFVGRVEKAKGIEDLLQAYAKACLSSRTQNIPPLWIVGEYDLSYKEHLNKLLVGIKDHVLFMGQSNNVYPLYTNAIAVIIPSLTEGFGFVMPEAQSMGKLVIAHDIEGLHEQLIVGQDYIGSPVALGYKTLDELETIISSLTIPLNNTFLTIAQNGQSAAYQLYSYNRNVEQITNLYLSILSHQI